MSVPGCAGSSAQETVGGVGVVQPERQVKKAARIEAVDLVEAFRYLLIPLAAFGSETAGGAEDRVGLHEAEGGGRGLGTRPEFQLALVLEDAQVDFARGVRDAGRREDLREVSAAPGTRVGDAVGRIGHRLGRDGGGRVAGERRQRQQGDGGGGGTHREVGSAGGLGPCETPGSGLVGGGGQRPSDHRRNGS